MNLRDLEYIVAVDQHRHFGRAANAVCVSQPTLSGQIRKLEERLGITIFERSSRGVTTTPAGISIIREAQCALSHAYQLSEIARSFSDDLAGPFRLGILPTIAPYLAPIILPTLHEAFPNLELSLREDTTEQLLDLLTSFSIEAAIIATHQDDSEIESIELFQERFYLAVSESNPGPYSAPQIQECDIHPEGVLLLNDGHCLSDQIISLCNLPPDAAQRADCRAANLQTLVELVRVGYGYTFLPALAARQLTKEIPGVAIREILPTKSRTLSLVFRRSSPLKLQFAKLASALQSAIPERDLTA